jgi:multidrug efflux system outer membrane protein
MQKTFVRSALALSLVALTGCATVGSDFTEPTSPQAAAWRHLDAAKLDTARLPAQWWCSTTRP